MKIKICSICIQVFECMKLDTYLVLQCLTPVCVFVPQEQNLVMSETPEAAARRLFNTYDTEGTSLHAFIYNSKL